MAASSSSASLPTLKHDVFLSFRGEDTRHNFTGHLYDALCRNQINAYIDDEGLERGDEISRALKEAIERSTISVIILSKNYASSAWCLDELLHILRCHKTNNQIVLPVFYDVDPSDVRKKKGSYQTALKKHKDKVKVDQWRDALTTAANLAGWDLQVIRSERELVNKIVKDILKKLDRTSSSNDFTGLLVGIDRRAKKIEDALCIGSSEVRIVGIWGTGGIGKTTLARIVFHRLSSKFEACWFLEDIRVDWDGDQRRYYHSKNLPFDHKLLRNKRALVVLDNVNDPEQLEILARDTELFGPGSRIIVTTRDMQMLRGDADDIYEVERLDFDEARQLFCSNAFKKTPPMNDCTQVLLQKSIIYAQGLPLALKVLSSSLRGKRKENWEAELNKLGDCPNKKIINILRTSYDGLDDFQKCIFLDIACFFKDMFRSDVERIVDVCGLHPKIGIDDLLDKSLISIKIDNKIWMHDLIQQMAWDILKSTNELERCSRLWIPQDARRVLETEIGTVAIEGIFLDMSNISRIDFNPAAFREMCKLRLLKIFHSDVRKKCEVSIDRGNCDLLFFPDSLRYLHWEDYPWKCFPSRFRPENLVELIMPNSNVEQLWEGVQPLGRLKKIDLGHSENLVKLPDLSQALQLEHIYLGFCSSLCQFPSSIEYLGELKTLILSGCSSLRKFPKLPRNIICLMLSGTGIRHVPPSIQHLDYLEVLKLPHLASLPSFLEMKSLKAVALPKARYPRGVPSWIFRVLSGNMVLQKSCQYTGYLDENFAVEAVSISKIALSNESWNGFVCRSRNCLLFNWLEFTGSGYCIKKFRREFEDFSNITMRGFPIKADIGFCFLGDKIPDWFHHKCNGDTVNVSFEGKSNPYRFKVLGVAACAIVHFSRDYKDTEEFKLLCRPTYKLTHKSEDPYLHDKVRADKFLLGPASEGPCSPGEKIEASFKFWCVDEDYRQIKGVKVNECGIYAKDDGTAIGRLEILRKK